MKVALGPVWLFTSPPPMAQRHGGGVPKSFTPVFLFVRDVVSYSTVLN